LIFSIEVHINREGKKIDIYFLVAMYAIKSTTL